MSGTVTLQDLEGGVQYGGRATGGCRQHNRKVIGLETGDAAAGRVSRPEATVCYTT